MADQSYAVIVEYRGYGGAVDEWLVALRWDPYRKGGDTACITTTSECEAFVFHTLAAAEMAAVFVGGRVEEVGNG